MKFMMLIFRSKNPCKWWILNLLLQTLMFYFFRSLKFSNYASFYIGTILWYISDLNIQFIFFNLFFANREHFSINFLHANDSFNDNLTSIEQFAFFTQRNNSILCTMDLVNPISLLFKSTVCFINKRYIIAKISKNISWISKAASHYEALSFFNAFVVNFN